MERIEHIHSKYYIHRDVKPDNFLIGAHKESSTIYVIDFGLAKRYCDPESKLHISYKDRRSLTGTARYASVNSHLGIEQSRRDDLESLGYVLVYFLRGSLPWQGLPANNNKEKYEKIKKKKQSVSIDKLCEGFPPEFALYFKYCRCLKFSEKPNYKHLKRIFMIMFKEAMYVMDYAYDWVNAKNPKRIYNNEAIKLMLHPNTKKADQAEEEKSKEPNNAVETLVKSPLAKEVAKYAFARHVAHVEDPPTNYLYPKDMPMME